MADTGRRFEIRGTVQGVGFRPWIYRLALEYGLTGWVRNDASGVTVEVFGPGASLAGFEHALTLAPPPAAQVVSVAARDITGDSPSAFHIIASARSQDRRVSIPPDLATCDECLVETRDLANRRYRYPFTNCTNCGPRFTIAQRVPYDRPHTTMASFVMCTQCQAEYDNPLDRRFHAQPNACPACGPHVWLCRPDGSRLEATDPIAELASMLRDGRLAAIKGLGGFHLACDATHEPAVAELRRRKRRDEKPFAVMVRDLAMAESIAHLSDAERHLLTSVERPIVLVTRRAGCALAANIAPHNPTIGVMLPYTPLHHLLLDEASCALVMTSGNIADEPLAFRNDAALARLGGVVDVFLMHNRDIDTGCDDSVARVIAGHPVVFRRSRGYTPRAIRVPFPFAQPTLAVGALLKNTFCLGIGDAAYLGPHIGDLENLETYESFEHAIARMEDFVGVKPLVIAHDLHPEYLSTRYAAARADVVGIAVQHHHAHIASAAAERGVTGPVLGVAFDGTGFGTDGTSWGGEFLLVDGARVTRVGTFRPIALAGGDLAIRQVWRQALALLRDTFDGEEPVARLPLFRDLPRTDVRIVHQMLDGSINTSLARGVGRYFDAVGAIGMGRPVSRYEGQIALEWNLAADPAETGRYPYTVTDEEPLLTVDLRPMIRVLVADVLAGVSVGVMSARFHNTLSSATVDTVGTLLARHGPLPVVLSGGCFQNARLTETIVAMLGSAVQVVRHQSVPPGDGGLALGQAAVANAVMVAGGPPAAEGLCV